ncbi:two-component system LytT family response regulator [Lachnospiraceae bacterium PF1-21]|uniref:Stage 0 sporulation protein A homolog n=1 Tax=Ohessyouella blattaphilus TaxID=2949333 RepID=A0ABT1EJY7_9FIRM|nr:response regulator [Ohessyouella blattaphilus]MCP1111018.1 response regulator [Ohessyouella blattaphilus]MCR8564412.1 response regulator [Ohessyouella blattaphilus]
MNFIAVDDERPALRMLEKAIWEARPECQLSSFLTAKEALQYAKENRVDVAFLDINMAEIHGIELAKRLLEINEKTNILFVTGYQEFALEAFSLAASGYIMKPADARAIDLELTRLRNPLKVWPDKQIRIKCFGGFGIFVNGEALLISWAKPKELLAYLVHKRGAGISSAEIAAILWEDKEYNHSVRTQTQRVISQLIKLLEEAGIGYLIKRSWNSLAVDTSKFSCDYYECLEDEDYMKHHVEEYMSEYSWGETVTGYLSRLQ